MSVLKSDFSDPVRAPLVILFVETRGFTRISEILEPAVVIARLSEFFALVTGAVERYDGVVIDILNDNLIAAFDGDGDSMRAVQAAQDIQRKFTALEESWSQQYGIRALPTLILADASVVEASPSRNSELFYAAVGGYGAIGVIVEVELDLAENTRVERTDVKLAASDYARWFRDKGLGALVQGLTVVEAFARHTGADVLATDHRLVGQERARRSGRQEQIGHAAASSAPCTFRCTNAPISARCGAMPRRSR